MPPSMSTESESNQMGVDGEGLFGFGPPKDVHDETMDAPLPLKSASCEDQEDIADCNSLDMAPGHALASNGSGEPMCTL